MVRNMDFKTFRVIENKEGQNTEAFLERIWYQPYCTEDEINRILSPRNAKDFLLKKRADIVAAHPRFYRVYLALANQNSYTSFENSFNVQHYEAFLSKLPASDKLRCESIAYGDIYANDFNGYATKDEIWGKILYLNTNLSFFATFMNLALLDFERKIPSKIRINALRIAVRISIRNEAMDFTLDPRGIIPQNVQTRIKQVCKNELKFIAGHEFAHFLCDHLKDSNLKKSLTFSFEEKQYFDKVYNNSQLDEFEADVNSITRPKYSKKELKELVKAALIWFTSLDIVEYVESIIAPKLSDAYLTHPSAKDRYERIVKIFKSEISSIKDELELIRNRAEQFKLFLKQDISLNYDSYEMYGSAYLDKPNTEWRGKELVDRVDY